MIAKSGHASKPFLDRLAIIQGDITQVQTDAIATIIPQNLDYRGSLNESIRAASGHDLDSFILDNIYKPRLGEVYALPAFNLPARHILVGIMPVIRRSNDLKESDLTASVRKIMELSRCMLLKRIAFPLLASGKNGYPKPRACRLLLQGITDRMEENIEEIQIVCQDEESTQAMRHKLGILKRDNNL